MQTCATEACGFPAIDIRSIDPISALRIASNPLHDRALRYAAIALRDSFRNGTREPSIAHAMRVAFLVETLDGSAEAVTLALLHDVLKDGKGSVARIRRMFGRKTAEGVIALSRPMLGPHTIRRHTYNQVLLCSTEEVQIVKLADLLDIARSRQGSRDSSRAQKNAFQFLARLRARDPSLRMRGIADRVEAMLFDLEHVEESREAA